MYDIEFRPAVVSIRDAAERVLKTGISAVPDLQAAIGRHLHVVEGFNKLHISGEQLRDRLVRNCRDWVKEPGREELVRAIRDDVQWFAERYT